MARKQTCVHDRKKDNRGPIITPKGSWCYHCDQTTPNYNPSWGKARKLRPQELDRLHEEMYPPAFNRWDQIEFKIEAKLDDTQLENLRRLMDFELTNTIVAHVDKVINDSTTKGASEMLLKRVDVPYGTREVVMNFEGEFRRATPFDQFTSNRYPFSFPPSHHTVTVEVPDGGREILMLIDQATIKEFRKFQELQKVNAQIDKIKTELKANREKVNAHESEVNKGEEELHKLKQKQRDLSGINGSILPRSPSIFDR